MMTKNLLPLHGRSPGLLVLLLPLVSIFIITLQTCQKIQGVSGYYFDSSSVTTTWQSCDTFMCPDVADSTRGWAVYASRAFKQDEIVELTPLFVPLPHIVTQHSVLDHYVFTYDSTKNWNMVLFGMGGFLNHSPNPNIRLVEVVTPDQGENIPHLVGFSATRDIQPGEQLFVSYGDTPDDANAWFEKRGLMKNKDDNRATPVVEIEEHLLPLFQKSYCSNIYSGIGKPTWDDKILPVLNSQSSTGDKSWILQGGSRLASFDAGLSDVRSKKDLKKGEMIERSVGLVLSRNHVRGTPLGVLAFYWENMKVDHHQALINLRDEERLLLQYQGNDTNWEPVDRFQVYTEMTVLPIGGSIGLVRRVQGGAVTVEHSMEDNDSTPNCKLIIRSNKDHHTNVGVTLELIATTDIPAGEVLKLNVSPSGFAEEYQLLQKEMERTGQPHHPSIYDYVPYQEEEL
jgi:SET domain